MSGPYHNELAAATLSDGLLQLWTANQQGDVFTFWKQTSDANSGWTPASPFQTPEAKAFTFTAESLKDGRLHFFVVDESRQLWSTQKQTSDANAQWTPLQPFDTGQVRASSIAVGSLSDGRLQLFIVDDSTQIWTTWKQTTDAHAQWTSLSQFPALQGVSALWLAAGSLSDGRLQLFISDGSGGGPILTTWKQTTDPNSAWMPISQLS